MSFLSDSKRIVFLNPQRNVVIWDTQLEKSLMQFSVFLPQENSSESYASYIGLSPDGKRLAVSSLSGKGVDIWDMNSQRLLVSLPRDKGVVWCMSWSQDGNLLAVCRSNGDASIWNVKKIRSQLAELGLDWMNSNTVEQIR